MKNLKFDLLSGKNHAGCIEYPNTRLQYENRERQVVAVRHHDNDPD